MLKRSKKIINVLACAGILATSSVALVQANLTAKQIQTVKAATVKSRSYGVDVSAYQSSSVSSAAKKGANFAIVKVSEGTSYRNPKAKAQISSAKANGMLPMAYHFATFGASSSAAKAEAKFAVSTAKADGLTKGSYIACDWETGDGNNVNGGKTASTNAILAFMRQVKASGYKPLLYSGASLLNNNVKTSSIVAAFPNSLWVASYATMGRIDTPNFNYFPSMNGVIIWQFTDNWRGLNVDGNISLLPLTTSGSASSQAPSASSVKNTKKVMYRSAIYNKSGNNTGKTVAAYKHVTVYGGIVTIKGQSYYRIGSNSYIKVANVDGVKRVAATSAAIVTNKGTATGQRISAGQTVVTYGGRITINGQKCYRVNVNRYVPASSVK